VRSRPWIGSSSTPSPRVSKPARRPTTQVRFPNNSASRTVEAIWDGARAATFAPGQTSNYSEQNPGTHTIQWKDHNNGKDLTTIAWPNLVEKQSYIFPYTD
jgi:hypothetical protein